MDLLSKHDPGLAYLKQIKFERIRGFRGLFNKWDKMFGTKKSDQLIKQFDKINPGNEEFYNFKNSDPGLSLSISETFDEDIIRKACNYIAEHKQFFGKTILEIGCDIGIMTGFLGVAFPDSKIIAIERCQPAVKLAKERVDALGLENVEIRNCSLADVFETFDTVFSMRTLQENLDKMKFPYEGEPFRFQCLEYIASTKEYTMEIRKRVKPNGTLCAFERIGHDPLFVSWLNDLSSQKLGLNEDSYEEVTCKEVDQESVFQAFACQDGETTDTKLIFDYAYNMYTTDYTGKHELKSWEALVYLDRNAGRLIRGVRVYDNDKYQNGRYALFEDKDEEQKIYYLTAVGGVGVTLTGYNDSLRQQLLENLENQIIGNTGVGNTCVEIDPDDPVLEGNMKLFM